jgi:hypothetical protein
VVRRRAFEVSSSSGRHPSDSDCVSESDSDSASTYVTDSESASATQLVADGLLHPSMLSGSL